MNLEACSMIFTCWLYVISYKRRGLLLRPFSCLLYTCWVLTPYPSRFFPGFFLVFCSFFPLSDFQVVFLTSRSYGSRSCLTLGPSSYMDFLDANSRKTNFQWLVVRWPSFSHIAHPKEETHSLGWLFTLPTELLSFIHPVYLFSFIWVASI